MTFPSHNLSGVPPNWQFQQQQPQLVLYGGGHAINSSYNTLLHPPLLQPPADTRGSRNIRPGSMTDTARKAKVPLPETTLKCPRCESSNTKFCYFNNYSHTQPRHFCKDCRRYWTRGGTLRNVPVGGGCRRSATKSSSKKRSKSPVVSGTATGTKTNSTDQIIGAQNGTNMIDGLQFPFYALSTNQMGHEFIGGSNYSGAHIDPHIAKMYQTGGMSLTNSLMDQQWSRLAETTLTQLHSPPSPFLTNLVQQEHSLQPSELIYQFDWCVGHPELTGRSLDSLGNRNNLNMSVLDRTVPAHLTNAKMEDHNKLGLRKLPEMQAQAAASSASMANGNNQFSMFTNGIGHTWTNVHEFTSNEPTADHEACDHMA